MSLLDAIRQSPASVAEGVICFFSVWSILGLAGFHTYLIGSNQTTNEDIKGSFANKRGDGLENPYSEGSIWGNCCLILCGPNPPSLIDAAGEVPDELTTELINQQIAKKYKEQLYISHESSPANVASNETAFTVHQQEPELTLESDAVHTPISNGNYKSQTMPRNIAPPQSASNKIRSHHSQPGITPNFTAGLVLNRSKSLRTSIACAQDLESSTTTSSTGGKSVRTFNELLLDDFVKQSAV